MDLPPPTAVPKQELRLCVAKAALDFKLASSLLWAIIKAEGGKKGSMNLNSNGTLDLGVAQINSIHLPEMQQYYPDLSLKTLAYNTCINVHVAARLLREHLDETGGDIWEAVGRYHSKTDEYKKQYQQRVVSYWLQFSKPKP
ncbi:lytic transglycosylase domain-containing protein [Gallaecimonas kandeliae]|uniref:lytic transglycosylase domain-containing protein n=1 Tax=Gallaecimonas kandeliae TaxID=3029055 RepID=UPI002649CD22|nr:lytic transglycosylase domain-containing protein [Gallaecimonas kandeliae]WKE64461.1 lytic transglycosylase domain-containing protein [Gallaecimonas kandeliae]